MKAKALVERTQTIEEFANANRRDLERMAGYILKRWPAPNDYGVEDVVQDLLIEIWRKRLRFDASRGKTPEAFLSFNAISYAKRQVHKARRARGDRDFGRFEVLTSTGTVDDMAAETLGGEDMGETAIDRRDRLHDLIERCASVREAVCLFVLSEEESVALAGDRIYNDERLREICRVRCAADAREAVKQTLKEHAWHA
jgi:DNA-directed RNA polymerase specialized sigma24 family protein